ncbi:hypothetical protein [Alistipes finegoldii]|uniref:hypothetical protein n=1 Tax=Alistipes finegoldii TaxID=214856 RepID=UPI00243221C1|nr:hypothetical protein [Alistipes finegoldii]
MKKRSVKEGRCMGSGRSVGRRKASGTSAGEKRAERQPEKADKSSAGKSGRNITQKEAENQRKAGGASAGEKAEHSTKHPSAGTGGESEKSRRKNPAAFLHFRTAGGTPGDQ